LSLLESEQQLADLSFFMHFAASYLPQHDFALSAQHEAVPFPFVLCAILRAQLWPSFASGDDILAQHAHFVLPAGAGLDCGLVAVWAHAAKVRTSIKISDLPFISNLGEESGKYRARFAGVDLAGCDLNHSVL